MLANVNLRGGFGIIKTQIKRDIVYRLNFFIWSIVVPSWIVMDYFLWRAVYNFSGLTMIRGMTFEALISYYVASLILAVLTNASFDEWLSDQVRNGKLIKVINYPMSFIHFLFFRWLSKRLFINLSVFVPPLILLGYYLVGFNILNSNIPLMLISIALAGILTFCFVFLFAMLAFWYKDIRGVKHLREGIIWFMSGVVIPINFFPQWFQNVSHYLPFQYMRYIPAQIMIGSTQVGSIMVLYQFIWAVTMLSIGVLVWKRAYRKYTGVGV